MNNLTNQSGKSITTAEGASAPAVEPVQTALSKWFHELQLVSADARVLRFNACGGSASIKVQLAVLQPAIASAARQRELFYLEAFAAAKLAHFNIARTSKPQSVE